MRPNNFSKDSMGLKIEELALQEVCEKIPTPFYVYSKASLVETASAYLQNSNANDLICYSVKANGNINLLKVLANLGMGFDVCLLAN